MMIFEEWMKARPMNGLYWGDLKAAWDFATLEEREACAKVCYEIGGGDTGWTRTVGEVCADAIRMRSNVKLSGGTLMIDEKSFGLIACARAAWNAAKADSADVGWCPRCGSGNDVLGFVHLPGCTAKGC